MGDPERTDWPCPGLGEGVGALRTPAKYREGGLSCWVLPGRGLTSGRSGKAASSPWGVGWSPVPSSCANGRRRSEAYPWERGKRGGQAAAALAPAVRVAPVCSEPDAETCCNNRRPRVPLAASGGVGGRARGRGRLADAAANWWADPKSPRKRGRLSAVRQARLCGSGSPLLQHSPWQSQNLSAQPSPSAALRRHCSSRLLRLRPPFAWLICLKLRKISANPVPAAAGEYLPVVRLFAQLWPPPEGGGPLGLAKCGIGLAPTRAGSLSAADAR